MDISTPIPIFKSLLGIALHSLTDLTTPLKPPIPYFQPEAYESYIEDLNYAQHHLDLIPPEVIESWRSKLFTRSNSLTKTICENSIKGVALHHIENGIKALDTKIYHNLNDFYEKNTDEVDRELLSQMGFYIAHARNFIKEYIAKHLVEGTYLGFIDQGYFKRGKEFAFQQMMKHAAKSHALISLHFTKKNLIFVDEKIPQINLFTLDQLNRQNVWRYRWLKCEKVSDLDYTLQGQLKLYSTILESFPPNVPWECSYYFKTKIFHFEESLTHLRISCFNHMLDIKPKSDIENQVFIYLNKAVEWINSQSITLEKTQPFEESYKNALNLSKDAYESLFPKGRMEKDFETVMNDYIKAITEDQFTAAKWATLGYETKSDLAPFNWNKEAGFFENYKRKIDSLFKTQDHLDEIIDTLNKELKNLVEDSIDFEKYMTINKKIYSCWELRDNLDSVRIKLRLGFLKDIKTRVNLSNKTIWERMTQSLGNKVFRLALDGEMFDKTEPYGDILLELEELSKQYKVIISESNHILQSHNSPLQPLPYIQDDYPVFYDEEDYINYVRSHEMKALHLNIIQYNLERICSFQENNYFSNHLKQIKNLSECFSLYGFLKTAIKNCQSYNFKCEGLVSLTEANNYLKKIDINNLGATYKKYVITDWNNTHSLDSSRLLTSAANKNKRLKETGSMIDTTNQFPDIYPEIKSQLYNSARNIANATNIIFTLYPLLKLKADTLIIEEWNGYKTIHCPYLPECATNKTSHRIGKPQREQPSVRTNSPPKISIIEDYLTD